MGDLRAIVDRARKGDRSAMNQIYMQTVRYASAVCSRYLDDADDVRDMLQETYFTAFSTLDKFEYRGEKSLLGWISRIAMSKSVSLLRKKSKNIFTDVGKIPELPEEDPDVGSISQKTILKAIHSLPEGYRTVLNMYVFEEMSHAEIAQTLGISESTSASQYHRAKNALAAALKKMTKDE